MTRDEKIGRFGPGQWVDEPDHVAFKHAGRPCILHRNRMGAWCGYVAVDPGHPWHGIDYNDARRADGEYVEVHGGLTYGGACQGDICHKAEPGEPDNVWWVGFDCAHCGDAVPGMAKYGHPDPEDSYKTVDYVRAETMSLAEQAREVCS